MNERGEQDRKGKILRNENDMKREIHNYTEIDRLHDNEDE